MEDAAPYRVDRIDADSPTSAPHPEEMKGSIRFEVGKASLTISGRATPAGLVCAGLLACAVLIPIARMVTGRR